MKQAAMTYKGYSARPEYSAEDGAFFGRLLGINDLVSELRVRKCRGLGGRVS